MERRHLIEEVSTPKNGFCLTLSVAHAVLQRSHFTASTQDEIAAQARLIQQWVCEYLMAIKEPVWNRMWGQNFARSEATQMVMSPTGWMANHSLADDMIGLVALAITAKTGIQLTIEVLDDNTKAQRTIGSVLQDAAVVTVILRNGHYSGTTVRAALLAADHGSRCQFGPSPSLQIDQPLLHERQPPSTTALTSIVVPDRSTSDGLAAQFQESLTIHELTTDLASIVHVLPVQTSLPLTSPEPNRSASGRLASQSLDTSSSSDDEVYFSCSKVPLPLRMPLTLTRPLLNLKHSAHKQKPARSKHVAHNQDNDSDADDFIETGVSLPRQGVKRSVKVKSEPQEDSAAKHCNDQRRLAVPTRRTLSRTGSRTLTFGNEVGRGYVYDPEETTPRFRLMETSYLQSAPNKPNRGLFVQHATAGEIMTPYAGFEVYVVSKPDVTAEHAAYLISIESGAGRCIEGLRQPQAGYGLGSFANHSITPNCELVVNPCALTHGQQHLRAPGAWLRAKRDVGAAAAGSGETATWTELTVSYGRNYWNRIRDDKFSDSGAEVDPTAQTHEHGALDEASRSKFDELDRDGGDFSLSLSDNILRSLTV